MGVAPEQLCAGSARYGPAIFARYEMSTIPPTDCTLT